MAGLVFGARGVEPSGNAAVDKAVAIIAIEVDLRIVSPALHAGFRVESHNAIESGGEIESAVYKKRCGLEAAALSATAGFGNVARVEGPGDFEGGHVFAIDLSERGVAHAACVVTVIRPGIDGSIGWGWQGGPSKDCTDRDSRCSGTEKLRAILHSLHPSVEDGIVRAFVP